MNRLKFTASFEVNPTFGSREIRLLKPGEPFGPPHLIRVKGRVLGLTLADDNCHGDICPGNICPDDICPDDPHLLNLSYLIQ